MIVIIKEIKGRKGPGETTCFPKKLMPTRAAYFPVGKIVLAKRAILFHKIDAALGGIFSRRENCARKASNFVSQN